MDITDSSYGIYTYTNQEWKPAAQFEMGLKGLELMFQGDNYGKPVYVCMYVYMYVCAFSAFNRCVIERQR